MYIYKKYFLYLFLGVAVFFGVSAFASAETVVETNTEITSTVQSSVSSAGSSGSSESEVFVRTHLHSQNGTTTGEMYVKESKNGTTREFHRVLGREDGVFKSQTKIADDLESIIQSLETIFSYDFTSLLQYAESLE